MIFPMIPIALLALTSPLFASDPDAVGRLFQRLRHCVYEVVVPKYPDTGASYAERLPVENIPFQERSDSVWSIGSAFAVGRDTVLTAAHVLELGRGDSSHAPLLRDAQGRMYRIGRILKYSSHQDFALFTVPGLQARQPLRPARNPQIGQTVHAVGNALGEGIVLRAGLLTSRTPERESGEWNYWRFSAAASPGNSGGPLVDAQGGLVGVVLMKSESENLNYALPWSVVAAFPGGAARWRQRSAYTHPAMPERNLWTVSDTTFALTGSWKELDREVAALVDAKALRDRDSLLSEQSAHFFPRGKSGKLMLAASTQTLPAILRENQDGWWALDVVKAGDAVDLGGNGVWRSANENELLRASIRIPDTARLPDLVDDSRHLGDLLLKGGRLLRDCGGRQIRVTSLGKAVVDSIHIDRWSRRWLVRAWMQPWDGEWLVAWLLPVPSGFRGMLEVVPAGPARPAWFRNLSDIADAAVANWSGTIAQWRDWQARPDLSPPFLATLRFDSAGGIPEVGWDGALLRLVREVAPSAPKPTLVVYSAFRGSGSDSTRLVPGLLELASDGSLARYVLASRSAPPGSDLPEEFQGEWQNRLRGKAPSDGSPVDEGKGKKTATKAWPASLKSASADTTRTAAIWSASVGLDGGPSFADLRKALDRTVEQGRPPRETPFPR